MGWQIKRPLGNRNLIIIMAMIDITMEAADKIVRRFGRGAADKIVRRSDRWAADKIATIRQK